MSEKKNNKTTMLIIVIMGVAIAAYNFLQEFGK